MTFTAPAPEQSFEFNEDVIFEYTHGECWYLALALQQKTDLPVVAIWGDGEIQHVGIELPNSGVVDIEGVWNSNAWGKFWYDELDDCDEVYVGETTEADDNWNNAIHSYSEDMLTQVTNDNGTLGEIADVIVANLHRLALVRS
ncbi:MAG: hypothetical protein H9W81_03375 [Enterococcus sp.]|nr:hypothetical protein [Enterococcus sp.]